MQTQTQAKRVFQDTAAGSLELSYWSEGVEECTETRGKGGRGGIGPGPVRAGETTAWGMKIEGYTGVWTRVKGRQLR